MTKINLENENVQLEIDKEIAHFPVVKTMTKNGSITIPAYLRRMYNIRHKDKYELRLQDNGDILLKRIDGVCPITGKTDNLVNINGLMISADILYTIKDLDNITLNSLIQTREEIEYNILKRTLEIKNKIRELKQQQLEEERQLLKAKKKADKAKPNKKTNKKSSNVEPKKNSKEPKLKKTANRKEVSQILKMDMEGIPTAEISKRMGIEVQRVNKAIETGR